MKLLVRGYSTSYHIVFLAWQTQVDPGGSSSSRTRRRNQTESPEIWREPVGRDVWPVRSPAWDVVEGFTRTGCATGRDGCRNQIQQVLIKVIDAFPAILAPAYLRRFWL